MNARISLGGGGGGGGGGGLEIKLQMKIDHCMTVCKTLSRPPRPALHGAPPPALIRRGTDMVNDVVGDNLVLLR